MVIDMVGLLFLSHYITKMNDDNSSIVARANSEWGGGDQYWQKSFACKKRKDSMEWHWRNTKILQFFSNTVVVIFLHFSSANFQHLIILFHFWPIFPHFYHLSTLIRRQSFARRNLLLLLKNHSLMSQEWPGILKRLLCYFLLWIDGIFSIRTHTSVWWSMNNWFLILAFFV